MGDAAGAATLAVPGMILGETALSFLGIGLRPPVVSWGVLMQQAQNYQVIVMTPWLMIPGLFVVLTVMAFNLLGDGCGMQSIHTAPVDRTDVRQRSRNTKSGGRVQDRHGHFESIK